MLNAFPTPFPQSTVSAQRALCAIQTLHNHTKLTQAFQALYTAFWAENKPISKPEIISTALGKVFTEEEVEVIMTKATEAEAKKRLGENSDRSMDKGAFGLPWFVATNGKGEEECFWGVDHLGQVVEFLGLDRGGEVGLRAML